MSWTRVSGFALAAFGAVVLLWGVLPFGETEHEMEAGPLEMRVEEKEPAPVPPLVGVIALAAGVALVIVGGRRGSG